MRKACSATHPPLVSARTCSDSKGSTVAIVVVVVVEGREEEDVFDPRHAVAGAVAPIVARAASRFCRAGGDLCAEFAGCGKDIEFFSLGLAQRFVCCNLRLLRRDPPFRAARTCDLHREHPVCKWT